MAKLAETKFKPTLMNTNDGKVAIVLTGKVTGITNDVILACKPAKTAAKAIENASTVVAENGLLVGKFPKV